MEYQRINKTIVNKTERYAFIHVNINKNKPDDINENVPGENIVTYVSDVIVSIEGSYLRLFDRSSRPVERLEPTLKGQLYNNLLSHKVNTIYGNTKLKHKKSDPKSGL